MAYNYIKSMLCVSLAQAILADEVSESNLSIRYASDIIGSLAEQEQACTTNADCVEYPYEVCGVDEPGRCGHKKVFPQTGLEIIGLAAFSFVMALCVIAGIGGGGIAVAMIIAFFYFI